MLASVLLAALIISLASCGGTISNTTIESINPSTAEQQPTQPTDELENPTQMTQGPETIEETIEDKAKKAMKTLEVWDGSVAESFNGGDGSLENPYQIANGAQLAKLSNDVNSGIGFEGRYFSLTGDILLNDISNWNFDETYSNFDPFTEGNDWIPIGVYNRFMGNFDGSGHTIYGLYSGRIYDVVSMGYFSGTGLFGHIQDTSICNLNMACSILTGEANSFGSIVGINEWSTVSNCASEEIIIAPYSTCDEIGGIGGKGGEYFDCYASGVVLTTINNYIDGNSTYNGYFGGITGYGENIEGCYSDVDLIVVSNLSHIKDGEDRIYGITSNTGGIAGGAREITNCYNSGNIALILVTSIWDDVPKWGEQNERIGVGGISGYVTNCSNCGNNGTVVAMEDLPDWVSAIVKIDTLYSDALFERIQPNCEYYPKVFVGGISGWCRENISFCYSSQAGYSDIATGYAGGITGASGYSDDSVAVVNCVYGSADNSIGAVGYQSSRVFTDQIKGASDEELVDITNYKSWDFDFMWMTDGDLNNGLPMLQSLIEYY